jgi:predicted RNA binding protein YcfA (HicA-like mRNA interferase family)
MGKKEKLLEKAQRAPQGLKFGDFETLLRQCDWTFDHQTGSHRIWYSPKKHRLSIQEARDGKAKGYQVRQFLAQYEKETTNEE